jgi:ferric-dicitrate binding protein FerR (iron transport regulator)
MPNDSPSWDSLARYLAGECPPAEADAVRQWLARDPRGAELVATLERTMRRLAFTPPRDLDVDAALRRVTARRGAPAVPEVLFPREDAWTLWRRITLPAAAAAVLLIGGGLVWRALKNMPPNLVAQTYRTPVGRSDSINLRDGSHVLLGPGSELTVEPQYGEARRDVTLWGEALFEVRHDERRPFTVRAGAAIVSDVGTTFAVRSDAGDEVQVVVTSGAVVLRRAGAPAEQGVVINSGDRGALRADGRAVAKRDGATDADLAWTRGRLIFHRASLARVRADLRRWYGIELLIADSEFAGRNLTASFAGDSARQVLDVIARALGVTIERRGQEGADTAVIHATSRNLRGR